MVIRADAPAVLAPDALPPDVELLGDAAVLVLDELAQPARVSSRRLKRTAI